MEIKICGVRRPEDIEIINKYKPEYIGFVFAKSKRQITPQKAAELSAMIEGDTKTVGVFVNASRDEVLDTVNRAGLDVIQLHGDETEEYIKKMNAPCEVWKAIRVRDGGDIPDVDGADKILLDKYIEKEYGGGGSAFDWTSIGTLKVNKPIILAGGLDAANVIDGINIFHPVCVDVSSSVETDGFKDEKKIREFIETVRKLET